MYVWTELYELTDDEFTQIINWAEPFRSVEWATARYIPAYGSEVLRKFGFKDIGMKTEFMLRWG
jgi:hypothetical protein